MSVNRTKLTFKGKDNNKRNPFKSPNVKDSKSTNIATFVDESTNWFECKSLDQIYGPAMILQKDYCLAYDDLQHFHCQKIESEPTNVSQIFIVKKLLGFIGLTNSLGFYLNSDLQFHSAAMGTMEQLTIEQHNDQFAFKSVDTSLYVSLDHCKLVQSPFLTPSCLFHIKCQSKIVNQSKIKRKTVNNDSTLGLPIKKQKTQ